MASVATGPSLPSQYCGNTRFVAQKSLAHELRNEVLAATKKPRRTQGVCGTCQSSPCREKLHLFLRIKPMDRCANVEG